MPAPKTPNTAAARIARAANARRRRLAAAAALLQDAGWVVFSPEAQRDFCALAAQIDQA